MTTTRRGEGAIVNTGAAAIAAIPSAALSEPAIGGGMALRTLADVEALVLALTPEGITLDYKGDFTSNLDSAKKELAKDVAAFANSQGGTLVIGVAQDRRTGEPQWPPEGVPRRVNDRQPIEEWIGQGLNQNIAQRVGATIRLLDLDAPDRCLVLIDVPPSPRAPHMVTYQQDNRFYRRYFRRHQFESLPAEEYEVREMFQRSLRYADAVGTLLDSRGYLDRRGESFGQNELTERLAAWHHPEDTVTTFVSFLAIPTILTPDALDTASENLMRWINSHRNTWHPTLGIRIVPDIMRYTLDGLLFTDSAIRTDDSLNKLNAFMLAERSGYVEYATARLAYEDERAGRRQIVLTGMLGFYWAFLDWVCKLYHEAGIVGSFRVFCNIVNAGGTLLSDFAPGWRSGDSVFNREVRRTALDRHIQTMHEFPNADQADNELEAVIRQTDLRIEQAYNYSGEPRAFHPSMSSSAGQFGLENMRHYQ